MTADISTLEKKRSYLADPRHLLPMVRDAAELLTLRLFDRAKRHYVVNLGRHVRGHAFDARDTMPVLSYLDLSRFLGGEPPEQLNLPALEHIARAGLGGAPPYITMATIAAVLKPRVIFETGTFRGISALTFAMNSPESEIYTLDLPPDFTDANTATLTSGDVEWTRIVRGTTGIAFQGRPEAARIHQLFGDSLTFDVTGTVPEADLCLIDGGHSYECVKADTENAFKILKPGGLIVWDDYCWSLPGVSRYLHELSPTVPMQRLEGSAYVLHRKPG